VDQTTGDVVIVGGLAAGVIFNAFEYGGRPKTALRSGLAVWIVFRVVPMMAMPMDLFPKGLLAIVIALGLADANLAALLGAWLYKRK